ncbi:MAG: TonB family protein [Alistipes sp.]|nr:TonB family protein [Alistipes sp.]
MYYYDPNDRSPRRWAVVAAVCYAVALGVAFAAVSFDFTPVVQKPGDTIFVEFVEPPVVEPPQPVEPATQARVHDVADYEERTAQIRGDDPETRTPNPKALFNMNKSGADRPADAGNRHAREGEEQSAGTGPGADADGLDQLDKGLQGRGLVGHLPRPSYPGTRSGKIVVRVTVGPRGEVTSAAFEPKGSTESDPQLVEAALAAARKARFTESRATVQGGTITYVFRME